MKSGKVSPIKRALLHTLILSLSLIVGWQATAHAATTVTFGDNTNDDFPGTVDGDGFLSLWDFCSACHEIREHFLPAYTRCTDAYCHTHGYDRGGGLPTL